MWSIFIETPRKSIHFILARIYIIDYYKQQHYQRSMSLFSGNFYVVFILSSDGFTVYKWRTRMTKCCFKQLFFTKTSFESKTKCVMNRKLVTKNVADFAIFCCSLCKSRKWEIKIKALNIVMREKKLFIKIDIQLSRTFDSLRNLIDKAGSIA